LKDVMYANEYQGGYPTLLRSVFYQTLFRGAVIYALISLSRVVLITVRRI